MGALRGQMIPPRSRRPQRAIDRYGHLMPDLHRVEASKLDRLVFGSEGDGRGAEAADDGSKTVAGSTKGLAT